MAISIGSIKATLSADSSGFTKAMGLAKGGLAGFAGAAAKAVTAAAAVGAAVTAASVKIAGDFESSLVSAGAKANATEMQLQQMKQAALEASGASEFSAKGAADALGFLAQAGFTVEEQMSALPGVLSLASAGELELAAAADIASNVLTGFGKSAGDLAQVNDVLVATANSANTSVSQLGHAMSFAAPSATGAGIAIEEAASVIGKLSDAGIQGGRAGRSFNTILGQMSAVAGDLGGSLSGAEIKALGFSGSLEKLQAMGLTAQNAVDKFGQRAGPAIQALLSQGTGAINELTGALENAAGTAGGVAAAKIDTLNGAMNVLGGNIQNVAIKYGDAFLPALREIIPVISGLAQSLVENKQLFRDITDAVIAAVPVLADIVWVGGEIAATFHLMGASGKAFAKSLSTIPELFVAITKAVAGGDFAEIDDIIEEQALKMMQLPAELKEARSEAFQIQLKGREIATSLDEAAESARRNVDRMRQFGDAAGDAARETERINKAFGAFPELPGGGKEFIIGGSGGGGGSSEPGPGLGESSFDLAAATNREAQKLDAQRANQEARLNTLAREGNELAAKEAEQRQKAIDRRRRMQNAEDDFAAAAYRAFRARVKQAEAERRATVEMIGFAQSATGELTGLAGAIAKAGGASSKAQSAIGGVGDLLGQGLGVAGNLASGNILGAITGGIGAITSGVGLASELFGMGGKGSSAGRDRMSMEEFGRIAGKEIADQLNDRDLRPINIDFSARGDVTSEQFISSIFDGLIEEARNRGGEVIT